MKILKFIKKAIVLSIGFAISIFFALTTYSLSYVALLNFGVNRDNDFFELAVLILPLIALISFFVFLLKNKSTKIKLLGIFCLAVFYILSRSYAVQSANSYFRAMKIVDEAETTAHKEWLSTMESNDSKKYIEAERKYVGLYKQALEIDLRTMPRAKDYIENKYSVIKEILDYDEQIIYGTVKPTEEETNKKGEEFKNKLSIVNSGAIRIPFWMSFFFVV